MVLIDWLILGVYLLTLGASLVVARRPPNSPIDFFVAGRSLPWWLAGTSMAATTFAMDIPLYLAVGGGLPGMVSPWTGGGLAVVQVVMIYGLARQWRRSAVFTETELIELRYGGRPAAWLRGLKALVMVPLTGLWIGAILLAIGRGMVALQFGPRLGGESQGSVVLVVVGVSGLALLYAAVAGLWGVVAANAVQFVWVLLGGWGLAIAAVSTVGGMGRLVSLAGTDGLMGWLPASTVGAGLLGGWALRWRAGGGDLVQRLLATRSEAAAEKAAGLFHILYYGVCPWPWGVVALVAVVVPPLADGTPGYLALLAGLPPLWRGLVAAALWATGMATVSSLSNWGAAYITHDVYGRFVRPQAGDRERVWVGRLASGLVTVLGVGVALLTLDLATLVQLQLVIGGGLGGVLLLRWFWWRINAAAELAALLAAPLIGGVTSLGPGLQMPNFELRMWVTFGLTSVVWLGVMGLTAPESAATLEGFYRRVRPAGPGWWRQRSQTGLPPLQALGYDLQRLGAILVLLMGLWLGIGGFWLHQSLAGWGGVLVAGLGGSWRHRLGRYVPPMPRPGLADESSEDM